MEINTEMRPRLSPLYVFRWEASPPAHILLTPEALIKLNPAAAEIFRRCDGERPADAIIADLDATFPGQPEAIARDTQAFLREAQTKGWLRST